MFDEFAIDIYCQADDGGELTEQEAFAVAYCQHEDWKVGTIHREKLRTPKALWPQYTPGPIGAMVILPLVRYSHSQLFSVLFERDKEPELGMLTLFVLEGPEDGTTFIRLLHLLANRFDAYQHSLKPFTPDWLMEE